MEELVADLCLLLDSITLPEHQNNKTKQKHADKKQRGESEPQLDFKSMHARRCPEGNALGVQKTKDRSQIGAIV